MKVCATPSDVTFVHNFADWDGEAAREKEHSKKLREWLKANGFKGKHTGRIVRFGVADGYAQYMIADGKKSYLIFLTYGDSYHYRDVEYLPKAEIIRRADPLED